MRMPRTVFTLCGLCLCSAVSLRAQTPTREVSLSAGAMQFDASGTGTVPVAALRISAPLVGRWFLGDASVSYAALDEQFSSDNTRIGVVEGQLQAQVPVSRFHPYIGVGGGWLHYFTNAAGRPGTGPTLSGAAGLRIAISSALLVRGELRVRTWESSRDGGFHNGAAEVTGGLGYAF
jgi:hypothetical protein